MENVMPEPRISYISPKQKRAELVKEVANAKAIYDNCLRNGESEYRIQEAKKVYEAKKAELEAGGYFNMTPEWRKKWDEVFCPSNLTA